MKNSFTLIEVIFTITIFSIISISIVTFLKTINEKNLSDYKKEVYTLDINSTFLLLEKNMYMIDKVKLKENKLFLENIVLLEDVSKFEIIKNKKIYYIKICIDNLCKKAVLHE